MTLALYIAFLISQGRVWQNLDEVLADFAKIESFAVYCKATLPYVLSDAAKAEADAGRKIGAIKIVRAEHPFINGRCLGLREAKDIVDAYMD
jgi:hypothetical protein